MDDPAQTSNTSTTNTNIAPKNKSYSKIALVVVIIFIIGVLTAYVFSNKVQQQNVVKNTQPVAMTSHTAAGTDSNAIPFSQAVPLASVWNTSLTSYTNPAINITFDYPSSYRSYQVQPNTALSTQFWVESPTFVSPTPTSAQLSQYSVQVFMEVIKNPENKPLLTVIKEKYQGSEGLAALLRKLTPTNVPVVNSYVFKGTLSVTPLKKVFFANKGLVYEVTLDGSRGVASGYSPQQEQFFDQLVSTIKAQ